MRVACFDITGTLIHHKTREPIPLMPKLLQSLRHGRWEIRIVTSWGESSAEKLLAPVILKAGLSASEFQIHSGSDKASVVASILAQGVDQVIFVDDRPEHIEAVCKVRDPRLRVFGFLGSQKYAPQSGECSAQAGASYALSAIDLAEHLSTSVLGMAWDLNGLTAEDLVTLVPGLRHPWSATAGETSCNDHRQVPSLLDRHDLAVDTRERLWMHLAWVRCNECMFKWVVRLGVREFCQDKDLLGEAYKVEDHLAALHQHPEDRKRLVAGLLEHRVPLMRNGIDRIGRATARAACLGGEPPDWAAANVAIIEHYLQNLA